MRFLVNSLIGAMALTVCGGIARADTQPSCPNGGSIKAMMVPNKYVAESIYRAVGGGLVPWNFRKYPMVAVEDEGDHWAITQTVAAPSVPSVPTLPTVASSAGGTKSGGDPAGRGKLTMDINKCTGAISHAALDR